MIYTNLSYWFVRINGLLLLPSLFYDNEIFFLVTSITYFHIKLGIRSILIDYFHNKIIFAIFVLCLRILVLEFIFLFIDLLL